MSASHMCTRCTNAPPKANRPLTQTRLTSFLRPSKWMLPETTFSLSNDILFHIADCMLKHKDLRMVVLFGRFGQVSCAWRDAARAAIEALRCRLAGHASVLRTVWVKHMQEGTDAMEAVRRSVMHTMRHLPEETPDLELEIRNARHKWRSRKDDALLHCAVEACAYETLLQTYHVSEERRELLRDTVAHSGWFPDAASVVGTLLNGCELCGTETSPFKTTLEHAPLVIPACLNCLSRRGFHCWVYGSMAHRRNLRVPNPYTVDDATVISAVVKSKTEGAFYGSALIERARRVYPSKSHPAAIGRCRRLHTFVSSIGETLRDRRCLKFVLWVDPPPQLGADQRDCSLASLLGAGMSHNAHEYARAQLRAATHRTYQQRLLKEQAALAQKLKSDLLPPDPNGKPRYRRDGPHDARTLLRSSAWDTTKLVQAAIGRDAPLTLLLREYVLHGTRGKVPRVHSEEGKFLALMTQQNVDRIVAQLCKVLRITHRASNDVCVATTPHWKTATYACAIYHEARVRLHQQQIAILVLASAFSPALLKRTPADEAARICIWMRDAPIRIHISPEEFPRFDIVEPRGAFDRMYTLSVHFCAHMGFLGATQRTLVDIFDLAWLLHGPTAHHPNSAIATTQFLAGIAESTMRKTVSQIATEMELRIDESENNATEPIWSLMGNSDNARNTVRKRLLAFHRGKLVDGIPEKMVKGANCYFLGRAHRVQ